MESILDLRYSGTNVNRIGYDSHLLQIQSYLHQVLSSKNLNPTVLDFHRIRYESDRLRIELYLDWILSEKNYARNSTHSESKPKLHPQFHPLRKHAEI